jgi:hypothetical protein
MSHGRLIPLLIVCVVGSPAWASGGEARAAPSRFGAVLDPVEEVPSISSDARGRVRVEVDPGGASLSYELSYEALEGQVSQAHLHFGQPGVNGGVVAWLCGTVAVPGPTGTPACPDPGGVVVGTLSATEVLGTASQGIPSGGFPALLLALRSGLVYANLHSSAFPTGEARGQLRPRTGGTR